MKVLGPTGEMNARTVGERSVSPSALNVVQTQKTFSVFYLVRANSINENEDDALNAIGIPALRSLTNGAFLKKKIAREIDSAALLWEVECQYDSNISSVDETVIWSWSSETAEEVLERDIIEGTSVTNSVGEPIIITAPVTIPVLTVERIQPTFDPDTILNFVNRVNSVPFYGAPAKTALMASITDRPENQDGVTARRVTYVVKFNLVFDQDLGEFRGWRARPLNEGTRYSETAINPTTFDPEDLMPFLIDDIPTTGNLNLDGTKNTGTTYVHLTFNRHLQANFNVLNLGPFV